MIVLKGVVAMTNIFFFTTLFAFLMTLDNSEAKANPITTAFFVLLMLNFVANIVLIITS